MKNNKKKGGDAKKVRYLDVNFSRSYIGKYHQAHDKETKKEKATKDHFKGLQRT
jgi:hypothetical protein